MSGKCFGRRARDLEQLIDICEQCGGDGLYGHECGEDCCVCLHPEDNKSCDLCGGLGWVYVQEDHDLQSTDGHRDLRRERAPRGVVKGCRR